MSDRGVRVALERIDPTAALPPPDKGRLKGERASNKRIRVIELSSHRVNRATSSQYGGIVRIEYAGPLAKLQRAGPLFCGRRSAIVQNQLGMTPGRQGGRRSVVRIN